MNSPPSRFWPGALTPLRVSLGAQNAVWRSSSYHVGRRISPDDIRQGLLLGLSLPISLAIAILVWRCVELAPPNLRIHVSFADEPEYRYEHSPPQFVTSL
jgi:hypothetical protein